MSCNRGVWEWRPFNGRLGLRMAVWLQVKVSERHRLGHFAGCLRLHSQSLDWYSRKLTV